MKEQAEILREHAQSLRQSDEKKMVSVPIWEENPEKKESDFIRPDPASQ
jgi:hypothetical protein